MLTLALPSTPESVTQAVESAEAMCVRLGLSDETVMRVGLAVAEAVANAVEHGNDGVAQRDVSVVLSPEARALTVEIQDQGQGVDADRLRTATLPDDPLETGGRGLFLIRELADRVEIEGPLMRLWFSERS